MSNFIYSLEPLVWIEADYREKTRSPTLYAELVVRTDGSGCLQITIPRDADHHEHGDFSVLLLVWGAGADVNALLWAERRRLKALNTALSTSTD